MNRNATTKVSLELVKHEGGQFATSRFQIGQERRPVFLYRSVKEGRFGAVALVRDRARERVGVTACSWLRGKHQQELSATGRYLLLAKHNIRHALPEPGSTTEATAEAAEAGRGSTAVARKTRESPAGEAVGETVGWERRMMIRTHQRPARRRLSHRSTAGRNRLFRRIRRRWPHSIGRLLGCR